MTEILLNVGLNTITLTPFDDNVGLCIPVPTIYNHPHSRDTQASISLSHTNIYIKVMVFNATFNNGSVISWRSVLLVEETGIPEENRHPQVSDKLYDIMFIEYTSP